MCLQCVATVVRCILGILGLFQSLTAYSGTCSGLPREDADRFPIATRTVAWSQCCNLTTASGCVPWSLLFCCLAIKTYVLDAITLEYLGMHLVGMNAQVQILE